MFVKHEGKKALEVRVDHMAPGKSSREDWEKDVFAGFSAQIKEHVGDDVYKTVVSDFSTTTPTMR